MGLGDQRLIERLAGRDESALREAMERHGPQVHGIALRVLTNPVLAEEVVQDTFLLLWNNPAAFDARRGSLRSFLCGVARNRAIDVVRREESQRRKADMLAAGSAAPLSAGGPDLEAAGENLELKHAVARLSETQRQAIALAYFGGLTYREVAVRLGIPEGTAKTRLREGLIRLRGMLEAPGEGA
ncbi:MAG TPA: sigma-70 family RNA polymerase sigma factor [Actinomycetota bacterium]|nr:sigma-70 family RNA polymerase sigma factor [Actinomycetota bacterium]